MNNMAGGCLGDVEGVFRGCLQGAQGVSGVCMRGVLGVFWRYFGGI